MRPPTIASFEKSSFPCHGACKWITIPLTAERAQRTAPTHDGQVRVDYPESGREYGMAIDRATHSHWRRPASPTDRSEEHTSELQSLMRISYAVFCLKKKKTHQTD